MSRENQVQLMATIEDLNKKITNLSILIFDKQQ